jgi:UDP-glucose 4-epimerase
MNILVAGGAGYLGRALVSSLVKGRHMVRTLDLQPPSPTQVFAGCEHVHGDLLDAQGIGMALRDIEAVYHLAWSFYPGDCRSEAEENLVGTLNLLDACSASGVSHFIFASTAVVYGPTGEDPACEVDPCRPERSTIGGAVYGVTKLACEHYAMACRRDGLPVTFMRIHGVFSRDRLAQFSTMIDQATQGREIVAFADAGGQYAHLDDVIWALSAVLGRGEALGETFNVAGHRLYRDREIAGYIARKGGTGSVLSLLNDPGQAMISVSVEKLSQSVGYSPRKSDFLRGLIDARFG